MTTTEAQRQNRSALEAELKSAGGTVRGNTVKCPFHDDRHPSASMYQDEAGVWRLQCNAASCGFGGDIYDVRAKATGRPVEDILKEESAKDRPKRQEKVYETLDDVRAAIGVAGHIESEHPYSNMVVFRLRTPEGKTYRQASQRMAPAGWVLRAPEKPWQLYRREEIADAPNVIMVEGEKAADALTRIGVMTATTCPCGAGKSEHCDLTPLKGKRVWLWPDNDQVGRNHMRQVMAILEKLGCDVRVIEPGDLDLEEHEDAADLIALCQKLDMDPLSEIDRACTSAKRFTLSSGLHDRIEKTISGEWAVVAWPWPKLTQLSRALLPQTVTIICGSPGAAKSFLVFRSLMAWFDQNIPWACLALEEDRTYHLNRVLALREQNINLLDPDWLKAHPDEARATYERHRSYLDRFGKRIWDAPVEPMSLDAITDWIRERARAGCRVVVVDPITAASASKEVYVADNKFVNEVKAIVRSFDMSLLIVTHPKKGSKMIGLDDLAGGAAYQRLGQCILWLERHKKPTNVTVAKDLGRCEVEVGNTLHICKARNGRGHGVAIGINIDWPSLEFSEEGIVLKESK